ncbi:hypothetical protein EDB80DRAFT_424931 [Ilyonectria destructans]|nr:hypothetical protein EDB80DRAFT_424931 [Ilyonectria destructans]
MSSARFSDPEDRHRQGRITRTNSSLDLDLDRARSELDRAQDALLRDRVRERRHRLNLEDDDFDYHDLRFEIDELEELVRRWRRLIERGAQTARHIETDSPMVRLMRLLSDVPSSVPDSRRGTRSSALPQAGGSSVSSSHHQNLDLARFEEIKRMLRVDDGRLFRSQHLTTQRTASSSPSVAERNNALLNASGRPAIRPRSVGLANPSGGLATPSTEVSPVVPNQEPSPEAKMRNKLLNLLWSQPVGLIHGHLSKSRVKGSGEWLFALPRFESWRKSSGTSKEQALTYGYTGTPS